MKKKSTINEEVKENKGDGGMKSTMQKNIIVMMVFSVFIAIFALLNAEIVQVNLIFWKLNLSAALIILISATIGAIIIYSFDAIILYKLRKKIKDCEKKIKSYNDVVGVEEMDEPDESLESEQAKSDLNKTTEDKND